MNVLVIGAGGFLGAHLVWKLQKMGDDVIGTTSPRQGYSTLEALGRTEGKLAQPVPLEPLDITDARAVGHCIGAAEADVVYHLAAVSIVGQASLDVRRCMEVNILGTLNVLDACQRNGVQRVVVASSDKAYGAHGDAEYTEDTPLCPVGTYEVSKAATDQIARSFGRNGLSTSVVRAANIYGAGDLHWSRLVPGACRRAFAGTAPLVWGAAAANQREWVRVEDVVSAYVTIAARGVSGEAYNVGSGEVASPLEVAQWVADYAGAPDPMYTPEPGFYEIPTQRCATAKLRALGWAPYASPGLEPSVRDVAAWYRRFLCD